VGPNLSRSDGHGTIEAETGLKYAGMGVGEIRRLKQLEEENQKLKQLAADLSLDKLMRCCPHQEAQ